MCERVMGTRYYRAAVRTPGTVLVQPAALVRGLATALPPNVELFEESPVLGTRLGPPHRLETAEGAVSAPRLLLATNGYTPARGSLSGARRGRDRVHVGRRHGHHAERRAVLRTHRRERARLGRLQRGRHRHGNGVRHAARRPRGRGRLRAAAGPPGAARTDVDSPRAVPRDRGPGDRRAAAGPSRAGALTDAALRSLTPEHP